MLQGPHPDAPEDVWPQASWIQWYPVGLSHPGLRAGDCHLRSGWPGVNFSTLSARVLLGRAALLSWNRNSAPATVLAKDWSAVRCSQSHAGPPRWCTTSCPASSGWYSSVCTAMCGSCGTARSGEGPPPQHDQQTPARSGGETPPEPSARSGQGPPTTTGSGPQPGVAGTRTQAPEPGVARGRPPSKHHHRNQARSGEAPTTEANTAGGGGQDEGSPQGMQARGPASGVLGAPPVTVSAPPEHRQ